MRIHDILSIVYFSFHFEETTTHSCDILFFGPIHGSLLRYRISRYCINMLRIKFDLLILLDYENDLN